MTIKFVAQKEYFSCSIPCELEGHEVKFIHLDIRNPEPLRDLSADIIFLFRPDFIPIDILWSMNGKKVFISTEPIERDDVLPSMAKMLSRFNDFDAIFHYDKIHIDLLRANRIPVTGAFPLPVNLATFQYDQKRKFYQLFFSGRSTVHREMMMSVLKRDYTLLHAAHGLTEDFLCWHINMSAICLNLHVNSFKQNQHRMQTMIACGAFVLSEPLTHNDDLKAGLHFVEVNGRADLEHKVAHYLTNPDEAWMIAMQGMEYVRQNLNAEKNWLNLINQIA